ncbi:hypothetical protein [Caulobacter sp. 1776]|uniref:hypothetical protein n=1 Tax=Caulobacter sp. 1776 TaxID=3156420 RepID=UPI003399DF69
MRAIVLSVVLMASPALAQVPTATPAPLPQVAAPPAPTPAPVPSAEAPVSTAVPNAPAMDSAQIPQALDPLADLIAQSNQTTDEETAETANTPAPKHRATILPIPPPEPEAPVTPGGDLTKAQVYEMRVKGSIAAAQNLQGPLDGGWRITGADGAQIYALQIVDKAGGQGQLEGAWRDVRRPGTVGSTGLIEDLRHDGDEVVARFSPKGGQSSVLTLRPTGYERWSGELVENGASQAVVADHLLPQAPPGYEGQGRGPYVWPVAQRAAVSRSVADPTPACSTKGKKGKALKAAKAKCAAAAKRGKASSLKKGKGGKAKATAGRKGKATVGKKSASKKKRR